MIELTSIQAHTTLFWHALSMVTTWPWPFLAPQVVKPCLSLSTYRSKVKWHNTHHSGAMRWPHQSQIVSNTKVFVLWCHHHNAPLGMIFGWGWPLTKVTILAKIQHHPISLRGPSFVTWHIDQKWRRWCWGLMSKWKWLKFGGDSWFRHMKSL